MDGRHIAEVEFQQSQNHGFKVQYTLFIDFGVSFSQKHKIRYFGNGDFLVFGSHEEGGYGQEVKEVSLDVGEAQNSVENVD